MPNANSISRLLGKLYTKSTSHRAITYDGYSVRNYGNEVVVNYHYQGSLEVIKTKISSMSDYLTRHGVANKINETGYVITIL